MEFIKEINIATGEEKEIAINATELKKREKEGAETAAKNAEAQAILDAKATARAEILNRLGLTVDEAAILLG